EAWFKFFAIKHDQPENSNELFQKLLEDLKELAEYDNSSSKDRPIFLNDNEEHYVQNEESLENSSKEINASNPNQEKEEPPQDSDIHQLVEECSIEVSKEQKQSMEDTILELVKICRQKDFFCMHDNVDDLIESALNTKLLSINSQYLDKKEQEVKNVVEQPPERGNCSIESLQNFRVIHKSECDVPAKDDCSPAFTTFSNPLFNNDDLDSSDDESLPEEDVLADEFKVYSNPLFDEDEINSDMLDPHCFNVESYFVESLLNRDTFIDSSSKFDFSGELAHVNPEISEFDFDFVEEIHLIENLLEEIDIVTKMDDVLPPGIENSANDPEGDIRFLEELLIDDSIHSHESSDSNFEDNPSVPLPPPKPPDEEFDFGDEISIVIDKLECIDAKVEFENDNYSSFMFAKVFSLLSAKSEDTIFDPGNDYAKTVKNQSKPGNIGHEIGSLHQKPDQRAFFYNNQANEAKFIEFGDSYEAPQEESSTGSESESFAKKKGRTVAITTEDMHKRMNDVKARTTLLLALSDEHQLRCIKYKTAQEFSMEISRQKVQRHWSKPSTDCRPLNRGDLDTMSLDDVYNHLKVYEPEVQNKSESNYQNMAFISSAKNSSRKGEVNTACILTANTQVSSASADVAAASISYDTVCAYIASQFNGSQIKYEDINQIEKDDIEEMDIKWNMALLSMWADKFWKKTGEKITKQGTDVVGFDKSKVECFNCHKMGHFARECRAPRSQDRGRRENYKYGSKVKESDPKDLMAIDGVGWDWSYMANEEKNHALVADDKAPTEFALMAKSSSCSKNEEVRELIRTRRVLDTVLFPPPTQVYSPPKKDMSWTGLHEFVDDPITDYSRPSSSIESKTSDLQNSNFSVSEHGESSESTLSKPMIKFVKAADSPTVIKTNKFETVRKSSVKYAEMYRNTSKSPK
nr:hypothetical protein [Tanacetum cinerariifolium]